MTGTSPEVPAELEQYVLRLYVTGTTKRSMRAIEVTREICDAYLKGHHELEIIDLYLNPDAAAAGQVVAAPTLVKVLPAPLRRIIGDLSNRPRVLAGLGLAGPAAAPS
jgi:circadian clock protein KaiB